MNTIFCNIKNEFDYKAFLFTLPDIPNSKNFDLFLKEIHTFDSEFNKIYSYYYFHRAVCEKYSNYYSQSVASLLSLLKYNFSEHVYWLSNKKGPFKTLIPFFKANTDAIDLIIEDMETLNNERILFATLKMLKILCEDEYKIQRASNIYTDYISNLSKKTE